MQRTPRSKMGVHYLGTSAEARMTLIIPGESLVLYKQYLGQLGEAIDPEGFNIIERNMLHNDTYIRCFGMFKVLNSDIPYEATVNLPVQVFNRIVREIDEDEINRLYETIH